MRLCMRAALGGLSFAICSILASSPATAHGVAGNRFFPATLATDDPAVADELSVPTIAHFMNGDDPSAKETDISGEYSKRLTPDLGLSLAGAWTQLQPQGGPAVSGFQNLETTLKYQFPTSAEHETIVSAGLSVEWGGTGSARVGAEDIGTVTPTLYFGKGAGDLPESLGWAKPFAITGFVGYSIPTQDHQLVADTGCEGCTPVRQATTRTLKYGITLQYSLRYLSAQVKDYGLPNVVNQLTPLVEFAASTPVQNGRGLPTIATVNPGVIWSGRHMQIGLEAQAPINRDSGKSVGVLFQVHWFLDDLFASSIGGPIWGG
jgi:hypothetical protein